MKWVWGILGLPCVLVLIVLGLVLFGVVVIAAYLLVAEILWFLTGQACLLELVIVGGICGAVVWLFGQVVSPNSDGYPQTRI